jgi:hypothetical protein
MTQITINNFNDLLDFIKRKDVNSIQATEIVCKALNVISIFEQSKEDLIKQTEFFINTYCQNNNSERPIFLDKIDLDLV